MNGGQVVLSETLKNISLTCRRRVLGSFGRNELTYSGNWNRRERQLCQNKLMENRAFKWTYCDLARGPVMPGPAFPRLSSSTLDLKMVY